MEVGCGWGTLVRRAVSSGFFRRSLPCISAGLLSLTVASCGLAEDERDEKNKYEYLTFADAAFGAYCVEMFDLDGDGRLSRYEAQRVVRMNCAGRGIASLYGIDEFSRLRRLDCSSNALTELDVRRLAQLEWLDCSANALTTLDIAGLRGLTWLDCSSNALAALDPGGVSSLSWLDGHENRFTTLDLKGCSYALVADLTANSQLHTVYCLPGQDVRADASAEIIR